MPHPTRLFRLALAFGALLLLTALTVSVASAQAEELDPTAQPNFGGYTLESGFQPDPYIVTIYSGGSVNITDLDLGAGCVGFGATSPDYRIRWSGDSSRLRFFFVADGDTTLIVNAPSGEYSCNDDFSGLNPLVEITNPEAGDYNIWVGSYADQQFIPGYLVVSEQESGPASIISSLLVTTSVGVDVTVPPTQTAPETPEPTGEIEGLQSFPGLSVSHANEPVNYEMTPPAGGEHAGVWQNCGVYRQPVRSEQTVHSLEHGVVWITYRPNLPAAQIAQLEQITSERDFVLLSPFPGLPGPVYASAWGYQVALDDAFDPRLEQFIAQFEVGPTAPEPGAPCTGGDGDPLDR